jgi:CTP:molybdopterin cytidylyltransferase MocA
VVLAAGGGRRFAGGEGAGGAHKLRAPFRGRPLAAWAIEAAAGAGLDAVLVVTGAVALDDLLPAGAHAVHNPRWAEGQASSLQVAVAAARAAGWGALVVGLADQPLVPAAAWRAVADGSWPVTTATFDGRRRPPVRLAAEVWDLLPTDGDEGARVLMARRPDLVGEVACAGEPADVDTVEDLWRWS